MHLHICQHVSISCRGGHAIVVSALCLPEVRECGASAPWRSRPRTQWGLMQCILDSGHSISPLLSAPGVQLQIFRIDWLHAADQGVTADFLGNLLLLLTTKYAGNNVKERVAILWSKIQEFYKELDVQDRLHNLVDTMLKQPTKAPKLRASAAQCRALVPFAIREATRVLDDNVPEEAAAKNAMHHLHQCYAALTRDSIFAADVLREHSTKFALQYVALEQFAGEAMRWRIKPKLHLFLHLCSDGSRPALCWTYRDEDYGGSVSSRSRRRGGLLSAQAFSHNLLARFRMQPMLRMRRT